MGRTDRWTVAAEVNKRARGRQSSRRAGEGRGGQTFRQALK